MSRPEQQVGIVTRAAAALIDALIVLAVCAALYLGVALIGLMLRPRAFVWPEIGPFFSVGAYGVLTVVYLTLWWRDGGRTPGNAVMAIRLTWNTQTHRTARSILRALLCVFFPIGLAWAVLDREQRSLADRAFGTRMIDEHRPTATGRS